jgi:hypothetical protein
MSCQKGVTEMKPEIVALVGTLAGALVGTGGTLAVTWIRSRTEERKHQRELVFQAGVENYRQACEIARQQGGLLHPLEDFLINMAKFSELFVENKLDPNSVEGALREMDDFSSRIMEFRDSQHKKDKQRRTEDRV